MSIRSNWCDFDKETRKYIKKRDDNRCVICGKNGALQIMHIFVSRAQGGRGCKENGCLGCVKCHKILDNPIGNKQRELQAEYEDICKNYLFDKENIRFDDKFINSLKYHKPLGFYIKEERAIMMPVHQNKQCEFKRCKNCLMLVKSKNSNSTIPKYFCKYKKIFLNKTTKACKKYKEASI